MSGRRADVPMAPPEVAARLLGMVVEQDGCWFLPHALSRTGYVKVSFKVSGRKIATSGHQVFYEAVHGRTPEGMELDHLCRVRRCVNPAHLEAVTARENVLRSASPAAENARKNHCPQGHEYTAENTYVFPNGRSCKTCMADRQRVRRAAVPRKKSGRPLQTHCLRGHAYDEANTQIRADGKRRCLACRDLYYERKKIA